MKRPDRRAIGRSFSDRLVPELGFLGPEMGLPHTDVDSEAALALVGFVAASYPGSKQYLIEQWNLPQNRWRRIRRPSCFPGDGPFL